MLMTKISFMEWPMQAPWEWEQNQGLHGYTTVLSRHTEMFKWFPATPLIPVVPATHMLVRRRVQQLIKEESRQGETQLPCLTHICLHVSPLPLHLHTASLLTETQKHTHRIVITHAEITNVLGFSLFYHAPCHPADSGPPHRHYHQIDPTRAAYTTLMSLPAIPSSPSCESLKLLLEL